MNDTPTGTLFVPQRQASDPQTVYVRDAGGQHPVERADHVTREQVARAPAIYDMATRNKKK